jgi:isopentenyl-diphosphate Delta-isomerase
MGDTLIQIVDEHDEPSGGTPKEVAQQKGLYHRIARIMVEDEAGDVLLQKRTADRELYPGRWDNSAAGHVDEGEDYLTAAKRELAEEIGLREVNLQEMGYYQTHGSFEWRKLNRFNKAYKVVAPKDTEFSLQPEEVAEIKWFKPQELKQLIIDNPEQVTDGVIEVFQRFYQ